MIDSLERRVILWWWNALGTAKNADSVYRLSLTAVQPALREFFYQSVPCFTCVMVKDWGLRETKIVGSLEVRKKMEMGFVPVLY